MKIKSISLAFIVSLVFYTALNAQSFGGHPSNVKWQDINTGNVRIIFPKGLEKRAFRIANIINHINKNNTYSVGNKSKKIDIVLQTNQVISNGFVTLAPYRSEFYATGFQNNNFIGSLDWLDALAVHEYRHALQYANANRGVTRFLYYFMGETGWALGMNLAIPNWYFEGDAVTTETVLSKAGRGRTPAFFNDLKVNLLNDKEYSYMTSRNGSFKHLLPNHYPFGYTLVNYVRNKYGAKAWKDILADAGRYKTVVYPFAGAVKKNTGKSLNKIYKDAYKQLQKEWKDELKDTTLIPTKTITPKAKKTITNYYFPQVLKDGSIVAIKDSYKEIRQVVHIKNEKETRLCNYGITPNIFLSENNGKLAWVELQKDPRRANRNYTRVVAYDINTKSKKYITSKSKYFSPQYSSDGNSIVVVKADENMQNKLVIIDGNNGKVIKELPNPKNDFLSFPKWTNNDTEIVFVAKRNSELSIVKYNIVTHKTQNLTNWSAHTIGNINVVNNTVYFTATYSGIDNIYAVNTNGNKKLKKITSVQIGAYTPAVSQNGKELVMAEPTDMGTVLTKIDLNNIANTNFTYTEPAAIGKYNIKTNTHEHNIFDEIEPKTYEVKPYKGFLKGTKLHSWGIYAMENNPSISLNFGNTLTNLSANVGTAYNKNEKKMNYSGKILYSKWFVEMGLHAKILKREFNYYSTTNVLTTEKFDENNYGTSLAIPLNWNSGSFRFRLKPKAEYNYHDTRKYKKLPTDRNNLNFGSITSNVLFSIKQMQAVQNIYPRYGIELNAKHQKSLKTIVKAERINTQGILFLPGLVKNHGLKINANWQKKITDNNFKFVDEFYYSRGYNKAPNDEVFKLSLNYALPLLYPDWGFAGITYFKRIRANLFYDMGQIKYHNITTGQNSYGIEIFFDNTIFNLAPFTFGLRQSFLVNKDILHPNRKNKFEVVFSLWM